MMRERRFIAITILVLLWWPLLALGQPDPPPGGPGGGDPPVGGSPLDGGLVFLLIFAGIYGLFLLRLLRRRHRAAFRN